MTEARGQSDVKKGLGPRDVVASGNWERQGNNLPQSLQKGKVPCF